MLISGESAAFGGLKRLVREPLVHFLLIGGAIFGLHSLAAVPENVSLAERIVISAGDVDQLTRLWERRWQRAPNPDEMRGLIADRLREEIFYREALALGLDRDDVVIRRHLAQKFAFLTDDLAAVRQPETSELARWFEANRERYRTPARISFTQVYFDPDRRGTTAESEATLTLARLRSDHPAGPAEGLGDGRLLDAVYRNQSEQQVEATFGPTFAASLFRLEPGAWSGPLASGYGLHLVRVDARDAGAIPPFDEIEPQVRNDWLYEQRQRANAAIYQELLARYPVTIEGADAATEALSRSGARP